MIRAIPAQHMVLYANECSEEIYQEVDNLSTSDGRCSDKYDDINYAGKFLHHLFAVCVCVCDHKTSRKFRTVLSHLCRVVAYSVVRKDF